MITLDDVANVFEAQLAATPAYLTAVPGDTLYDRGPDTTSAWPYGIFNVTAKGGPENINSDGSYLQTFTIRLAVYAVNSLTPTYPIEQAINALNTNPTGWPALRAGNILHVLPAMWDGKYAPQLREAQDVFLIGYQWDMLANGAILTV
jgi:hypothetical protein